MVRISVCRILASQNCDWVPVFEQFHSKHLNAENLISNRNMKIRENVHHLLGVFLCECVLNTNMALFNYSNSNLFQLSLFGLWGCTQNSGPASWSGSDQSFKSCTLLDPKYSNKLRKRYTNHRVIRQLLNYLSLDGLTDQTNFVGHFSL